MAWQKIPAEHHPLFTAALPHDPRASSMKMFGGIGAMVNGHMYAGLWADTVVVRLDDPERNRVLALPGGKLFDPTGKGKPMKDMVLLPPETLRRPAELRHWLQKALEFTAMMPPKAGKKKAAAVTKSTVSATPLAKKKKR
jgi:TfoX/Sxy family transcriptional regulator of competence genes